MLDKATDLLGSLVKYNDPTNRFLVVYMDNAASDTTYPKYYGFQANTGDWYIMKASQSGNVITYGYIIGSDLNGTGDILSTNWTNRATLTFNAPYGIF